MGSLDPAKILVILVIALIVLGPERLPRVARQLGGIWRELTRVREQVLSEIREAIPDDLPRPKEFARFPLPPRGAVSGFVSGLVGNETRPTNTEAIEDHPIEVASNTAEQSPPHTPVDGGAGALVIVHPELGDFAFVPDDPDMN